MYSSKSCCDSFRSLIIFVARHLGDIDSIFHCFNFQRQNFYGGFPKRQLSLNHKWYILLL